VVQLAMERRRFMATLAGGVLGAPLAVEAQPTGRFRRIGYLTVPSRASAQEVADSFRLALRGLGWIEGQNVLLDYRFADGRVDRLPDLVAELVRLRVDVIAAGANAAVQAAKNATRTIPIVMFLSVEPVGSGLVASFARPGGNLTGLTVVAGPEIYGKQLQLLKDAFPRVSRVAVLVDPASPLYAHALQEIEAAIRTLGLQRHLMTVRDSSEFTNVFAALPNAHADAIFVNGDSLFYQHRVLLAQFVAKTRLPAMWGVRDAAAAGGLMSYATDLHDLARRAAIFVDKILRGATPADLPVEQPTKFDLVINLKTAKTLGLKIPEPLLLRADEVIQ